MYFLFLSRPDIPARINRLALLPKNNVNLEKRGQIYFSLNIVRSALCLRAPFSLIKR